jgi:outer membrane protein assembly factor BamB
MKQRASRRTFYFVIIIACGLTASGRAADWPTHRGNHARTGATDECLRFPLAEAWRYEACQPQRQAWAEASNVRDHDIPVPERLLFGMSPPQRDEDWFGEELQFDVSPVPIVADGLAFFGSSSDDTVRALDLETGKVAWRFVTGGPVRFAPEYYGGKLYAASDDGFLYCLDARSGALEWKFRGGLSDRQFIGNGRMISRWPCRTGVVVREGIAYVVFGMWHAEGVYAYALDAATGQELWCCDNLNGWRLLTSRGTQNLRGLNPQGYLSLTGDTLLVPQGRGAPGVLDARTGKSLFINKWVGAGGSLLVVDEAADRLYGDQYAFDGHRFAPMQLRSRWPLIRDGETIPARNFALAKQGVFTEQRGRVRGPDWQAEFPAKGRCLIKAGDAVLVGGEGHIAAYDAKDGSIVWESRAPGRVNALAVAAGKLVATTAEGTVLGFGAAGPGGLSVTADARIEPADVPVPEGLASVLNTLRGRGVSKGYALVVGSRDCRLAQALAQETELSVICALTDEEAVATERERLLSAVPWYGARIAVHFLEDEVTLPYPQYFANVVITARSDVDGKELHRVLRPCGGMLFFAGLDDREEEDLLEAGRGVVRELKPLGDSQYVVRGRLPGAVDWNSQSHLDSALHGPRLELLWFGDPGPQTASYERHIRWTTGGDYQPMVPANGRQLILGRDHLTAVDAYNGTVLWKRVVPFTKPVKWRQFSLVETLSGDNRYFYLNFGKRVYQLDAGSGEETGVFGEISPAGVYDLDGPKRFEVEVDETHSCVLTLSRKGDRIELLAESRDGKVTLDDAVDLFFDFRPPGERHVLFGPGVFYGRLLLQDGRWMPPQLAYLDLPQPAVTSSGGPAASGAAASISFAIADVTARFGATRLSDFAFAAIVHAADEDFPPLAIPWQVNTEGKLKAAHLFGSDCDYVFNDGWAVFKLDSSSMSETTAPAVPLLPLAEAPELARRWGNSCQPYHPPETRNKETRTGWTGDEKWDVYKILEATDHNMMSISPARGGEGFGSTRIHPVTGQEVPRTWARIFSETGVCSSASLDFYDSSGFTYYDLRDDSGYRSFCSSRMTHGNAAGLTAALGLLSSHPQGNQCTCNQNFQPSFALVPSEDRGNEDWAVFTCFGDEGVPVRTLRLNFSVPGDRRTDEGDLWLCFPRPLCWTGIADKGIGVPTCLSLPVHTDQSANPERYRFNTDRTHIAGTDKPWIYGSGYRGPAKFAIDLVYYQPLNGVLSFQTETAPAIDGDMADACWDGLGRVLNWTDWRSGGGYAYDADPTSSPRLQDISVTYVRHDDKALYVVHQQTGTDPFNVILYDDRKDGGLPGGPALDLKVDEDGTRTGGRARYGQTGRIWAVESDKVPSVDWKAAVKTRGSTLTYELSIPWASIDQAGIRQEYLRIVPTERLKKARKTEWNWMSPLWLTPRPATSRYTVRFHFAEPDEVQPGQRVFDVRLNGKTVLEDFDIVREAGERHKAVVKEFQGVKATGLMEVELLPKAEKPDPASMPVICGMEIVYEPEGQSSAQSKAPR